MFSTIVSRVRSRRLSSLDRRRFNPFSNTHSFLDCVLSSEELGRGSRKENKRRKMKEKNIHFATIFSYQFFKITNSVRSKQTKRLVLQLISEGRNSLHAYASIIQKIQDFKLLHWDLHFNHTFREGNMCADELAKTGSSLQCNLQLFDDCPPS